MLYKRNDVLAVLLNGYDKSLIFQLFCHCCVAYCLPSQKHRLTKTIDVQSIGILAALDADVSDEELRAGYIQPILGSTETVIERRFLDILNKYI